MTLDRPKTLLSIHRKAKNAEKEEPPVLDYLVTLTRGHKVSAAAAMINGRPLRSRSQLHAMPTPSPPPPPPQTSSSSPSRSPPPAASDAAAASRKPGRLFVKNRPASASASSPSPSPSPSSNPRGHRTTAAAILRNVLRPSRSRDSILEAFTERQPDVEDAALHHDLWQHKSSVPVYVGWRPPMPLPKEARGGERLTSAAAAAGAGAARSMTSVRIRTNLNRKKSFSESDLLDSEYCVIDSIGRLPLLPSLPPTLPFLTPVLERLETAAGVPSPRWELGRTYGNCQPPPPPPAARDLPHTLPRQKIAGNGGSLPASTIGSINHLCMHSSAYTSSASSSSYAATSQRVQFSLGTADAAKIDFLPRAMARGVSSPASLSRKSLRGNSNNSNNYNSSSSSSGGIPSHDTFTNYSHHLMKRLQSAEGDSKLNDISLMTGNRCGPWYDHWPADAIVRMCEIDRL